MKTGIIVQARMMSTRLPGKVLKPVCGKPLLEIELERARRARTANTLIVATTNEKADDPIVALCEKLEIPYFRGSEDDVLARYYGAAREHKIDVIARVTADCPVIDPAILDAAFRMFLEQPMKYDYVSNTQTRTYPRGMDVEVFSFRALEEAHREANQTSQREHVTPFIRTQPDRYRLGMLLNPNGDESAHRWTVDVDKDFELLSLIIKELYPVKPDFCHQDIMDLIAKHPKWTLINKDVEQKAH
jgi:spore coat polysaccharide biosynthesis protein SpsF